MPEHTSLPLAGRRQLIKFAGASLILLVSPVGRAAIDRHLGILAVRVWPAADYTRVAIEHSAPLKYTHFMIIAAGQPGWGERQGRTAARG